VTFAALCEGLEADPQTRGLLGVECLAGAKSCEASDECGGEL
jgi:hypothetical protein